MHHPAANVRSSNLFADWTAWATAEGLHPGSNKSLTQPVKRDSGISRTALAVLGVAAVSSLVTWVVGLVAIWHWVWT